MSSDTEIVRANSQATTPTNSDAAVKTARGTVVVLLGNIATAVALAVSSIIVARLLGPSEYGLYVLALIPATFIAYFPRFGVSYATSKYVASLYAEGRLNEIKQIVLAAFVFMIMFGVAITVLFLPSSGFLASTLINRPYATQLVAYSSFLILGMALMQLAGGIVIGLDKSHLYSVILIVLGLSMIGLIVFLIIASFGVAGAVLGNALSYLVAGAVGLAFVYKLGYVSNVHFSFPNFSRIVKMLAVFGIPVSLSNFIVAGIVQYQGFVLSRFVSNAAIGSYGVAFNFITFMTILTLAITTSLVPAFSKINPKYEAQKAFSLSIRYSVLLMVPLTLFVLASADKLVNLVYGEAYAEAGPFLSLYVILFLSTGIGYVVLNSFFMGLGAPRLMLYVSLITLAAIIPSAWLLTDIYGVYGLIGATIIANFSGTLYGLMMARKRFNVRLPPGQTRMYIASFISAVPLFVLGSINPIHSSVLSLILFAAVFFVSYLVFLPLLGGLVTDDIHMLLAVVQDFQLIGPFIRIISEFESKLIALRR
jgi:O-antigen/teichoic acid export membrane protein